MLLMMRQSQESGVAFTAKSILNLTGAKFYSDIQMPGMETNLKIRSAFFWKQFEKGEFETECIQLVKKKTVTGSTVLDVGAWVGAYTLLFSELVGEKGKVYAFEPDPEVREVLSDNVEQNNLGNVWIERYCLSDRVGPLKFYCSDGLYQVLMGHSGSSLLSGRASENSREIDVESITIDKFCEARDIRPHGMKIDVEGAEALVIKGAQKTIRNFGPWVLLEFHGHFMTEQDRILAWDRIVERSKTVCFVRGDSTLYKVGDKLESFPDCVYFNAFIEY